MEGGDSARTGLSNLKIDLVLEVTASLLAQTAKYLSAMWETWVRFLSWEDPLEKRKTFLSKMTE